MSFSVFTFCRPFYMTISTRNLVAHSVSVLYALHTNCCVVISSEKGLMPKLPLDESGLNLSPRNAYLSMHSRFTSQALRCIGCSVLCSCHCAVSRFTSQTSLSSCVRTAKCYVGNFFLSTLPAYSSTDLPCDCLSGPISA